MTEKVSISTLDVRNTAGTSTVTKFTYDTLTDNGYDPYLIFNAIPWDECVTLLNFYKQKPLPETEFSSYCGMEGFKIERVLPEVAVFNYILNFHKWSQYLENASKHIVTGGTCIQGLPLAIKNEQYICWIGTTFKDQHELQIDDFAPHRKYRNKLAFPVQRQYERHVLESADLILAQSSHTKERITENIGVSESKVELLPFPVDTEEYTPGGATNDKEILFVGRINAARKNTALLLNAFAQVLNKIPDAELTLVGEKPNEKLQTLINELGIEPSINIEGRVPSVLPYYRRASVFALPSNQEGLGIVGLEAQSCGTPVVSTTCGGPEDYVVDGENGFLVPIGDSESFAESLITVLTDSNLRNEFGDRSREMAVANYSKKEIQPRLQEYVSYL
ncbi:glycosyltransferase family 4 protein [Haloarcula argentinensis]|uniref:Glycosyltransferase n=1 Tax=Haloarcula argentinensis TaxID=43776 RepID=A0A847UA15_HALAR|nr:glycosyltransferase family 4 protein [Haloarcula argentinensis]NLV12633.1 glycosyltransferase [Haloarcula argentinensis]